MKTKRARFSILCLTVLCCLLAAGNVPAQGSQGRRELSINKLAKRYPLKKSRPLTVIVNNIGADGVVSVEAGEETNELLLQACTVHYNENVKSKIEWMKIEKIVALSEDEVIFRNNTLTVDGHANPNKRVVVHLTVPSQKQFVLYVNGKQVGNRSLSANVMLQKGEPTANSEAGAANYTFEAAFMQATRIPGLKREADK